MWRSMGNIVTYTRRRLSITVAIVMAAVLLTGQVVSAAVDPSQPANTTGGNGMRVSPLRVDLTIAPGNSKIAEIFIENITNSPAKLRGIANDFVASNDESGIPQVLFDENASAPTRGLKKYVEPIQDITLGPKERRSVKVTVKMPKDIAGGGYYGAVRFLPANDNNNKNISLSASVGTLLLVTVPGDVKEQMGVESINVSRDVKDAKASSFFTDGKNLKTTIRFKNSGNIQESPFGKISLKKSGKEIASYEVNKTEPRGTVLPESVRRFDVKFGDKAKSFGKYTADGYFGYGNKGQLVLASTTFYVVPLLYVILAVVLVLLIVLGAFIFPRMLKQHDRRLIRKMRGGKG